MPSVVLSFKNVACNLFAFYAELRAFSKRLTNHRAFFICGYCKLVKQSAGAPRLMLLPPDMVGFGVFFRHTQGKRVSSSFRCCYHRDREKKKCLSVISNTLEVLMHQGTGNTTEPSI